MKKLLTLIMLLLLSYLVQYTINAGTTNCTCKNGQLYTLNNEPVNQEIADAKCRILCVPDGGVDSAYNS